MSLSQVPVALVTVGAIAEGARRLLAARPSYSNEKLVKIAFKTEMGCAAGVVVYLVVSYPMYALYTLGSLVALVKPLMMGLQWFASRGQISVTKQDKADAVKKVVSPPAVKKNVVVVPKPSRLPTPRASLQGSSSANLARACASRPLAG